METSRRKYVNSVIAATEHVHISHQISYIYCTIVQV